MECQLEVKLDVRFFCNLQKDYTLHIYLAELSLLSQQT